MKNYQDLKKIHISSMKGLALGRRASYKVIVWRQCGIGMRADKFISRKEEKTQKQVAREVTCEISRAEKRL